MRDIGDNNVSSFVLQQLVLKGVVIINIKIV